MYAGEEEKAGGGGRARLDRGVAACEDRLPPRRRASGKAARAARGAARGEEACGADRRTSGGKSRRGDRSRGGGCENITFLTAL